MDLLETPLEALAFRYFATAAGSLWAWVAVLAAALGLWRIRVAGSKPDRDPPSPRQPAPVGATQLPPPAATPSTPDQALKPPPAALPRACRMDGGGGTPKGRFTAYFHAEDSRGAEEDDGAGDVGREAEESRRWDEMAIRWRGDLGWYRHQDLTALDGSVVRLWDSDRGLTAMQRCGSRRRV